jgi:hypothetical protein
MDEDDSTPTLEEETKEEGDVTPPIEETLGKYGRIQYNCIKCKKKSEKVW